MNYLDLYLQRNNCKRYDVHKKTGVSQQLLSTYTNKNIEKYPGKILIALAETLNKTPGDVLNELLELERENPVFEAFNPSELLVGLKAKYSTIVIKGIYCKEIHALMKSQITEYELMGMALDTSILICAIHAVKDLFSNPDKKVDKDIERKLKLYELKEVSTDKLVLNLR